MSSDIRISTKPLTPEGFAPFGKAVTMPSTDATAADDTFAFWSDAANYEIAGETEIGYCTVFRHDTVDWMERHERTPEILMPIGGPFVLPVMTEGGAVEAFRVDLGQSVVIGQRVWHSACQPIDAEAATYFVVFRRGTPQEDVVKTEIEPVVVESA